MIRFIVTVVLMLVAFFAGVGVMLVAKMISDDDRRVIVFARNPEVNRD